MNFLSPRLSSKALHTQYQSIEKQGFCIKERTRRSMFGSLGLVSMPNEIWIDHHLPNYAKLSVVYHELGHHFCMTKKCKCFRTTDGEIREFHAHRFCMQMLHRIRTNHSLYYSMKSACMWVYDYRTGAFDESHGKAALRLFKSGIWRKGLKLFKDDLHAWILKGGIGKYILPEALDQSSSGLEVGISLGVRST